MFFSLLNFFFDYYLYHYIIMKGIAIASEREGESSFNYYLAYSI